MMPDGWEKHPVGKICRSIVPGRNKPKEFSGSIPWVTTPEIKGRYIPSKVQQNYVSTETLKECGGKIVPSGAVVMAAVGELGLVAIASEEVVLNQQLHAFICSGSVHNEYLAYWLSNQKPYMETIASKTTIPYLNKTNCESIPVALPPFSEQRKIAAILGTWDKAISTTERLIDNSKQQKKALMQQLLTGAHTQRKRLLDDSGKPFEGEWEKVKLKNISAFITKGATPTTYGYEWQKSGIPFLRSECVGENGFKSSGLAFISNEAHEAMRRSKVFSGDILITITGNVGRVCRLPANLGEANLNQHIAKVTISSDTVEPVFIYHVLNNYTYRRSFERITTGQAYPQLSLEQIRNAVVFLPSKKEQQKIAAVLTNADKEIKLLEQQLADLKQEKKALMQQLLTGKRRVKVDNIEAA